MNFSVYNLVHTLHWQSNQELYFADRRVGIGVGSFKDSCNSRIQMKWLIKPEIKTSKERSSGKCISEWHASALCKFCKAQAVLDCKKCSVSLIVS